MNQREHEHEHNMKMNMNMNMNMNINMNITININSQDTDKRNVRRFIDEQCLHVILCSNIMYVWITYMDGQDVNNN